MCSIETNIKEHHRHSQPYHPAKADVAEHSINLGRPIQLYDTIILANKYGAMKRLTREATGIEIHPDDMSRGQGISLSSAWKSLTPIMKKRNKALFKEK
jgi:hypothetical protein